MNFIRIEHNQYTKKKKTDTQNAKRLEFVAVELAHCTSNNMYLNVDSSDRSDRQTRDLVHFTSTNSFHC